MDIRTINLVSSKEAALYLKVGVRRFNRLVKKHDIPHRQLSCGKVFLWKDIEGFQKSRMDRLKHRKGKASGS